MLEDYIEIYRKLAQRGTPLPSLRQLEAECGIPFSTIRYHLIQYVEEGDFVRVGDKYVPKQQAAYLQEWAKK